MKGFIEVHDFHAPKGVARTLIGVNAIIEVFEEKFEIDGCRHCCICFDRDTSVEVTETYDEVKDMIEEVEA